MENEEITRLIEKQKQAGFHAITDGEFRRSYWHLDFMWGFQGIDEVELDHGYFFHGEETTHVCRGNYHSTCASEGDYFTIAPFLLAQKNVDAAFSLAYLLEHGIMEQRSPANKSQ